MTNHSNDASAQPGPNPGTDPRPLFASAFATAGKVIAGVQFEQLGLPTPCDDYNVEDLLGHLRMVAERVTRVGRDEPAFAEYEAPLAPADGDHARWWNEAGHEIQAAWSNDERLGQTVVLPWAQLTGAAALAGYLNEINIHTWDLAAATHQQVAWDDDALTVGFEAICAVLPGEGRTAALDAMKADFPPEIRSAPNPFADPVALDDGTPLIEQIVAWTGRDPRPWA